MAVDCLSRQRLRRFSRRNLSEPVNTGHLRCFPNQPVAEIVQCGEPPVLLRTNEYHRVSKRPFRFEPASWKRLLKDECAKFFGGIEVAMTTINNTEYRFLRRGAPAVNPANGVLGVMGAETKGPNSVFINTQGPSISQNILVPGEGVKSFGYGTGLRGTEFNTMLLLHELGHQVGIFGPDAKDPKLNAAYTKQVLKACF